MIELLVALYNEYLSEWSIRVKLIGKDYSVLLLPLKNRLTKLILAAPFIDALALGLKILIFLIFNNPHPA
jgi:hypothetical protein